MKHDPAISRRALGYRAVQVLGYCQSVIADEGMAPSYGMIRDELGFATKGEVCRVITSLERRGLLARAGRGRVRRIRLRRANANC